MAWILRCCLALLFAGPMLIGVASGQVAPNHSVEATDKSLANGLNGQSWFLNDWKFWPGYLENFARSPHFHAKNEKKFLEAARAAIRTSIQIIKDRPYIEKDVAYRSYGKWSCPSRYKVSRPFPGYDPSTKLTTDCYPVRIVGYMNVATALKEHAAEYSFLKKYADQTDLAKWLQGRDPIEYCETIAATVRPKPIKPPFRIGKITVEDKDRIYRATDASRHLVNAKYWLQDALKYLKEKQAAYKKQERKYWQTYEHQQARLRPLRRAYETAIGPAVKAEKARAASLRQRADSDSQKIRKRIDQIDRHLPLLDSTFTGPNAAQYAAERRKALLAERAGLQAKLGAISAQAKPKTEPQLRANSQDAKDLYERWQNEKHYSHIKMKQVGRDLEDAKDARDRAEDDVSHAEAALDKATEAWNASQRDQTVRLAKVSSDDFLAHFLTQRPDFAALNRLINELRAGLRQTEAAHAEARWRMLRQAGVVQSASEDLLHSAYKSLAGQAAVEIALEAKSLFDAGEEGGPYGVLAQAYTDLAWNIFSPPTYYDGQPKDLPIGTTAVKALAQAPTAGKQAVSGYGAEQATARGAKKLSKRTLRRLAKPFSVRPEKAVTREAVQRLRKNLADQMEGLSRITKDLDDAATQAGARGFAKTLGSKLATGILKGAATAVAKDMAKREIAQWVEGPALSHYLEEELVLSKTIRVMFHTTAMADDLRQTLAVEEKKRDELLKRYDSASGAYVKENRQFLAEAGYAFYLYPKKSGKDAGKGDASGQLTARVFLQGIELKQEPSPHGLKFAIRSADEAKFDTPNLPEKLALTIKLQ